MRPSEKSSTRLSLTGSTSVFSGTLGVVSMFVLVSGVVLLLAVLSVSVCALPSALSPLQAARAAMENRIMSARMIAIAFFIRFLPFFQSDPSISFHRVFSVRVFHFDFIICAHFFRLEVLYFDAGYR